MAKKVDRQIITLFQKYISEQCTRQELEEVFVLLKNGQYEREWQKVIDEEAEDVLTSGKQSELSGHEVDQIYLGIAARLTSGKQIRKLWPRVVAVAAVAALMVLGVYFFNERYQTIKERRDLVVHDVVPGKVGATLTLASGKKIRLSDAANGEIVSEAGVVVTKTADGRLIYEVKGPDADAGKTNTLSTGKGESYQLRLPDGSLVWLNAASSLTYAVSLLEHGKRTVSLNGEAYFEIYKDKKHPFLVKTYQQEVEVLGTHFNVNAYDDDEAVKTTLLEGSVRVSSAKRNGQTVLLRPNQQSILRQGSGISVQQVDPESVIAWKNGNFMFKGEQIEPIMRRLAYWYDIEVIYLGKKPVALFRGVISRSTSLSEVLKMMELTGTIHFKIEGRRVYVRE